MIVFNTKLSRYLTTVKKDILTPDFNAFPSNSPDILYTYIYMYSLYRVRL